MERAFCASPSRHVPWFDVLPLLNITPPAALPPFQVECPLCRGRLTISQDNTFGGSWHHCLDCNRSGDMIELAAAVWKQTIAITIATLCERGCNIPTDLRTPEAIATYVDRFIDQRDRHTAFREHSSKSLHDPSRGAAALLQKLNLTFDISHDRWEQLLEPFIGSTTKSELLNWGAQRTYANPSDAPRRSATPGAGWKDMIVIPFYDLPNRLRGLYICGRNCGPNDRVYRFYDQPLMDEAGGMTDPGLGMYSNMYQPTESPHVFQNTVIVMDDPVAAVRMQIQHLRDHELPLPLVAMFTGKVHRHRTIVTPATYAVWLNHPKRHLIFWSNSFSGPVFNTVARATGRVFTKPLPVSYQEMPPLMRLRYVFEHAVSWDAELERLLTNTPLGELQPAVMSLDLPPETFDRFLGGCSKRLRRHAGGGD
jgi:hypothetical protein